MDRSGYHRARAQSDFDPRTGQEYDAYYTQSTSNLTHYGSSQAFSYNQNHGHLTYSPTTLQVSGYPTPYYYSTASNQSYMYNPTTSASIWQVAPPSRSATVPSQTHSLTRPQVHQSTVPMRHPVPADYLLFETEDQESSNADTMESEPIDPPMSGYPDVRAFDMLMQE